MLKNLSTFYRPCSSKNVKCKVMFTEAYLKPIQPSAKELFCENSYLLAVNYFCKNTSSQMFDWVLNTPPVLYRCVKQNGTTK